MATATALFGTLSRAGTARRLLHGSWIALVLWFLVALTVYGATGVPLFRRGLWGDAVNWGFAALFLGQPLLAAWFYLRPVRGGGALEAGAAGLRWHREGGAERYFPRASLADGAVVGGLLPTQPAKLELALRDGNRFEATVSDREAAQSLLRALELDASKHTYSVLLGSRAPSALAGVGLFLLLFLGSIVSGYFPPGQLVNALLPVLATGAALGGAWLAWPARLVVGADGLLLLRGFGKRFIPYGELLEARVPSQLVLTFRDGHEERFSLRGVPEARSVLQQRIDEARRVSARASATALAEELDRRGRPLDEWVRALAQLLGQLGNLRTATLTREDLVALLRDPSAPSVRRVAAAVALLRGRDAEGPTLVRVAAASSASQPLRVALEKTLADALDEGAVRELEAQDRGGERASAG